MSSENPKLQDWDIKQAAVEAIDRSLISTVVEDIPRFVDSIPIEFPENFFEVSKEILADPAAVIAIISSHTSHMDALPLGALTKRLVDFSNQFFGVDRLKGYAILIASSMKTGDQGSVVKEGTDRMENIMADLCKIVPVFSTREKDEREYGIKKNNTAALRKYARLIKSGYFPAYFPEGTMQAGRIKNRFLFYEERFGMQEFKDIEEMVEKPVRLAGKTLFYMPVGIDGGFRLESPDNNRLTFRYLAEVIAKPRETWLTSVRVGLPIPSEEIGSENVNHFLGKKVAALLPVEARGVYK